MITYIRTFEFPECKYCHKQLDYLIPGLPYEKHSHSRCAGTAFARKVLKEIKKYLS